MTNIIKHPLKSIGSYVKETGPVYIVTALAFGFALGYVTVIVMRNF